MALLAFLLAGQRPEWGPPPPVAPFGQAALPAQRVIMPMVFPVVGKVRWDDGFGEQRAGFRHTGIDIRGPKMSPIVAPFSGTLGLKKFSFWIYADNGWAMLGTHLNDDNPGKHDHKAPKDLMFAPNLTPGMRVHAGQFIGYLGESGDATAPHLHFELYAPGTGPTMGRIRNPTPSLHLAKVLSAPVPAIIPGRPRSGMTRLDGCIRKIDGDTITLILVGKQLPNGTTLCVCHPSYVKLKLTPVAVERIGGMFALTSLPNTTQIGVNIPADSQYEGALISSIVLP